MPDDCCIPGYIDAVRSECRDRALSFIHAPEMLAGQCVDLMTPIHLEYLRAAENPFICSGVESVEAAVQFVWIVSKEFNTEKDSVKQFAKKLLDYNYDDLVKDIDDYLERTFLDAPIGKPSEPFYSMSASLVFSMSDKPFNWSMFQTMNTPLRTIYQLLKVKSESNGAIVLNKRSGKVKSDWLDNIQKSLDSGEISVEDLEKLNE